MVVKIPCELLCVIKVKGFFHKQSAKLLGLSLISQLLVADSFTTETSWPYLISELLVADTYIHNAASSWPRPFFTPKVFLFGISLLFV